MRYECDHLLLLGCTRLRRFFENQLGRRTKVFFNGPTKGIGIACHRSIGKYLVIVCPIPTALLDFDSRQVTVALGFVIEQTAQLHSPRRAAPTDQCLMELPVGNHPVRHQLFRPRLAFKARKPVAAAQDMRFPLEIAVGNGQTQGHLLNLDARLRQVQKFLSRHRGYGKAALVLGFDKSLGYQAR